MNQQTNNQENIVPLDQIVNNDNQNKDVISLDRLFDDPAEEEVVDAYEEDQKLEAIRQKRISKIQIGLIIFLAVFASIVYFFGYDIVEPYIKID